MTHTLGDGSTAEFISKEFNKLNLNDKRLNSRAKSIFAVLQNRLGSTIRRLFLDKKEARQAYDFF